MSPAPTATSTPRNNEREYLSHQSQLHVLTKDHPRLDHPRPNLATRDAVDATVQDGPKMVRVE